MEDKIYDEYYYKIYNWFVKKTNNKEDAEDLTNSVFVAIFEYFHKNINVEKISNLIWKIANNLWCTKAKEYIERRNVKEFDENINYVCECDSLDKVIYNEIVNDIDLFNLSEKEKASFLLYYVNDLSIKEISDKLNSKEANIKYYLYIARKKIKERYYE